VEAESNASSERDHRTTTVVVRSRPEEERAFYARAGHRRNAWRRGTVGGRQGGRR
jgi:hypothetical protein